MTTKTFDLYRILQRGVDFQTIPPTEESANHCSRKLWRRTNFVQYTKTINVQRHEWTAQAGSQGGWRSGSSKQNYMREYFALQCGQARKCISSSAIICKKEGGREVSSICYGLYKLDWFVYLIHVMNSVRDKIIARHSSCNFLLKMIATFYFSIIFLYYWQDELEHSRKLKLSLKLKSKMGLNYVVFTNPRTSRLTLTLTVVEI